MKDSAYSIVCSPGMDVFGILNGGIFLQFSLFTKKVRQAKNRLVT